LSAKNKRTELEKSKKIKLNATQYKTIWMLVAVFLIFIGPTYIVYLFYDVLGVDYLVSMLTGFILFSLGLIILVKNKKLQNNKEK